MMRFGILMSVGVYAMSIGCDSASNPTDTSPADAGLECRLNSDCPPGFFCDDGRCDYECREDRDCLSERCVSGECRDANSEPDVGVQCVTDEECGDDFSCQSSRCVPDTCTDNGCPAGRVCDERSGECIPDTPRCAVGECGAGQYCDEGTGRCETLPQQCEAGVCPTGFVCRAGDQRCVRLPDDCSVQPCPAGFDCITTSNLCEAASDCRRDGCDDGLRCEQATGDCLAIESNGVLGERCEAAAECETGLCVDVSVQNQTHTVCTQPCCRSSDCPVGFGCRYTLGVGLCFPSDIYPPGYTFDAGAGQSCGAGAQACQSGLCDLSDDRCIEICCNDADCGGRTCQVQLVAEGSRAICGLNLLGMGRTGQGCSSEFDCHSAVCVPVPGGVNGQPGQCADLCCTNQECGPTTRCGQVVTPGGNIVSACVPVPPGPLPLAEPCQQDESCESGHCIERSCRAPCCRDRDCLGDQRCLPRPNDEGSFVRVCVGPGQ